MSIPKASVCIPSYNHAKYLPAAIESILAQSYQNIEIVIIDDGSTDDSFGIANQYAEKHPDIIKVFTHPEHRNRGTSATVNLGFQLSTGEYWSGLPSDDMLHPRKIQEQVEFLEAHPDIGWTYCYAYYVDEAGRRRPEFGLFGEDITRHGDPVEYLLFGNVMPGMTPLMRRSEVAKIQGHDESLVYSDWDFWIRLAATSKVAFQPRARVLYRMHGSNTGFGSDHVTNLRRGRAVLLKVRDQATTIGGGLAKKRNLALIELQLAYFQYANGAAGEAKLHLASAFEIDRKLAGDTAYVVRWLVFVDHYPRLGKPDFVSWAIENLPAAVNVSDRLHIERSIAAKRSGAENVKQSRLKAHWETRRRVLEVLRKDPEALTDAELRRFYLEALLGSRVRNRLAGFFNS